MISTERAVTIITEWLAEGHDAAPRSFMLTQDNHDGEFEARLIDRRYDFGSDELRGLFIGVCGKNANIVIRSCAAITLEFNEVPQSEGGDDE